MPVLNGPALIENRVQALRQAHLNAGIHRAELDLSGGIDSAVMACLLVEALGPENVTLAHTKINTSSDQTAKAVFLAKALNCPLAVGDFTGSFNVIMQELSRSLQGAGYDLTTIIARCDADPTIAGSIRSTLRAPLGRAYNRLTGGGIRHGTGNEDEDRFLRFYQKGGDGEVDSNPIEFLSKGEVYQLAFAFCQKSPDVADALYPIIAATPTPDLWGKPAVHSDESELASWLGAPFTYSRISPLSGEYIKVGTIERINRFLDAYVVKFQDDNETMLFADKDPDWEVLTLRANLSVGFYGTDIDRDTITALLKGARKAEAATRHKMNPNIPAYGSREELLKAGILTNTLPVV